MSLLHKMPLDSVVKCLNYINGHQPNKIASKIHTD